MSKAGTANTRAPERSLQSISAKKLPGLVERTPLIEQVIQALLDNFVGKVILFEARRVGPLLWAVT